jgi:hypothetical protein
LVNEVAGSYVRLNRLAGGGWTWNIQVTIAGNSLEELREAKSKAVQLSDELFNDLYPQPEEPEF